MIIIYKGDGHCKIQQVHKIIFLIAYNERIPVNISSLSNTSTSVSLTDNNFTAETLKKQFFSAIHQIISTEVYFFGVVVSVYAYNSKGYYKSKNT